MFEKLWFMYLRSAGTTETHVGIADGSGMDVPVLKNNRAAEAVMSGTVTPIPSQKAGAEHAGLTGIAA